MNHVEAVAIATTGDDLPREKKIEAWQFLIDTGLCWRMSEYYARQAQNLIDLGVCTAHTTPALDEVEIRPLEGQAYTFSERDMQHAEECVRRWNEHREKARVGDFLRIPDGRYGRFAYDWGKTIQAGEHGSFFFGPHGPIYSGGLCPSIPHSALVTEGNTKLGVFWIFHDQVPGAGRGISFETPCRVWTLAAINGERP
jgi:hypothetical protein